MNETHRRDAVTVVNDLVLFGSALLSAGVVLLDSLGVLDQIPWLAERIPILALLSISFLLASAVIERRTRIEKIQQTLDNIVSSFAFGAQYLDDAAAVTTQLERITRQANESLMALGAKSSAVKYLNSIREAVTQRQVIHHRLLDGDYISHELHEHLGELVGAPNVYLSWTPREKFGNFVVTENEAVYGFSGSLYRPILWPLASRASI
jgi:hypothetical protein